MKKIIILFTILVSLFTGLQAGTDIYFGNGVWNDKRGANYGKDALARLIKKDVLKNKPELIAKYTPIKLSFNWTGASSTGDIDKMFDVVETFYQLRDSGQLDESTLFQVLDAFLSSDPLRDILMEKLDDIISENVRAVSGANLVEMITQYESETLENGDKVLLVAHSQGNLFGNEVFDNLLSDAYRKRFNMVSVGTPANRVTNSVEPYTTLVCDQVINSNKLLPSGIPFHLEGKMGCTGAEESSGHEFERSYLENKWSYDEIVENIKKKLRESVYLQVSRSSASISSVKLYMTDGTKSILVYPRDVDVHGSGEGGSVKEFSVRDGSSGTPSNTYDRYLSSKWAGTIYEGYFNDMVLSTMPFDGFTEGFWCNNTHGGNCKRDDNFPTYYILSNNSDYLNNIYQENFLSVNQ